MAKDLIIKSHLVTLIVTLLLIRPSSSFKLFSRAAVWPDLAKKLNFGQFYQVFGKYNCLVLILLICENSQLWAILQCLTKAIFKCLFWYLQSFEPNVAICLPIWAQFHCCKWPNIEQTSWPSGHTEFSRHNLRKGKGIKSD